MTYRALAPLRVLEFGQDVAAPYCGKLLADYGAEVIKVEPPGGDPARRLEPVAATVATTAEDDERDDDRLEASAAYAYLNANKRGIALDLDRPEGRRIAVELAKISDGVVENLAPGRMETWGLGYHDLAAVNPRLVYTSVSPFGRSGPYADLPATEIVVDALGGWMYGLGDTDREPLRPPGLQSEIIGGLCAAMATLGGYLGALATGTGDRLDVSRQEAVAWFLMNPTTVYEYSRAVWRRTGGTSPTNYPQGLMPCRDGMIAVNVMYYAEWDRLCDVLGRPDWRTDPRVATPVDRVRNAAVIDAVLLPWLASMTVDEAYHLAQSHKLPFARVGTVPDLLASEQLAARGYWAHQRHPVVGDIRQPGLPFLLSEVERGPDKPAPRLGEHTDEVLAGLLQGVV
jgi:crotonobetainyl-CoA:carnitine CoA-transferase CaiB-like acyl-CoA transferase